MNKKLLFSIVFGFFIFMTKGCGFGMPSDFEDHRFGEKECSSYTSKDSCKAGFGFVRGASEGGGTSSCVWNIDRCEGKWEIDPKTLAPQGLENVIELKGGSDHCALLENKELVCFSHFSVQLYPHPNRKVKNFKMGSWQEDIRVCLTEEDGKSSCFRQNDGNIYKKMDGPVNGDSIMTAPGYFESICTLKKDQKLECKSDNAEEEVEKALPTDFWPLFKDDIENSNLKIKDLNFIFGNRSNSTFKVNSLLPIFLNNENKLYLLKAKEIEKEKDIWERFTAGKVLDFSVHDNSLVYIEKDYTVKYYFVGIEDKNIKKAVETLDRNNKKWTSVSIGKEFVCVGKKGKKLKCAGKKSRYKHFDGKDTERLATSFMTGCYIDSEKKVHCKKYE